jgi:hypothetical protein
LTFFSYETNPRNESTKRILWKLCHETNPRNESFEHSRTKQIHKTNLLNTVGQNESTKQIFWKSEGFANPKLLSKVRLCSKDSSGFVGFVEKCHETNPRNKPYENCVTKRIHKTNLMKIASRNESTKRIFWKLEGFGFANPDSRVTNPDLWPSESGFAKRIHVFTNLLYDSRILSFNSKRPLAYVSTRRNCTKLIALLRLGKLRLG